ncbi:MAG: sialate O-acetylesterase [Ignavibacteriaceae bacterium]
MKLSLGLLLFFTYLIQAQNMSVEIPSIFSDNMALQQNTDAPFWGKAAPGAEISIKADWGETANASADSKGLWMTKLKTPAAGGPFQIDLQVGDTLITFKNVLTGEVWLGSGQSNMEMPLEGWPPNDTITNSAEEIKKADFPQIRYFTVTRALSNKKEFNCTGTWEVCTPEVAAKFGVTAYYFGRKLHKDLNVPVGIINSSWGGTRIEPWMSKEFLEKFEEYKTTLNNLESSSVEIEKYNEWLLTHPVIDMGKDKSSEKWMNLNFEDEKCSDINYPDNNWKTVELPQLWESTEIGDFDGIVWFRKKVEIPEEWLNRDLVIELGPVDDMERTFINGKLIGRLEKEGFWRTNRVYNIPKGTLDSKELVIAVRVIDNQGGGGIYGTKESMKIHPSDSDENISLSGEWKYLPVAEYRAQKFYVFGSEKNDFYSKPELNVNLSSNTPTVLFNAMINPIIPYSIKGAIWYQGESNMDNAHMYTDLFSQMLADWRSRWNAGDFPFYYVQIAPYQYGDNTHSELVREAQLKALSVPNTGMAVTMDIATINNIHPPYKKEVGERLALWALAKTYGMENIKYSGPVYNSYKIEDNKIILSFDYAGAGLVIKEINGENNFMIAGSDKIFKKAVVEIDNDKLILSNPEIKEPAAVRYAWSNTAEGTLFNKDELPSSSFRTDNWDN